MWPEDPESIHGDWEVGLFEFEYHRTWYNVEEKDSTIRFDHIKDEKVVREKIYIPYGYYTNIEELTDRINISFIVFGVENGITQMPQLRVDKLTRKINIHLFNGMRMIFSSELGNILGYNEREDVVKCVRYLRQCSIATRYIQHRRQLPVSICVLRHSSNELLWVIQKHFYSVHFPVLGEHWNIVREIYDKPMYVPIQKEHFESVEIDMRSDFNEPVSLVNGKSSVTLHFRMSKNPYFLQWREDQTVLLWREPQLLRTVLCQPVR